MDKPRKHIRPYRTGGWHTTIIPALDARLPDSDFSWLAGKLAGELNSVSWSNKKDVSRLTAGVMERERSTLLTSVKGEVAG